MELKEIEGIEQKIRSLSQTDLLEMTLQLARENRRLTMIAQAASQAGQYAGAAFEFYVVEESRGFVVGVAMSRPESDELKFMDDVRDGLSALTAFAKAYTGLNDGAVLLRQACPTGLSALEQNAISQGTTFETTLVQSESQETHDNDHPADL